MKVFVWGYLGKVSDNYPSGGGLLVCARDYDRALELIARERHIEVDDKPCITYDVNSDAKEHIEIFPDAGCC